MMEQSKEDKVTLAEDDTTNQSQQGNKKTVGRPTIEPNKEDEAQLREAKIRVAAKMEKLRQLKLVKVYRNRPEMRDLDEVTSRWLEVSHTAIQDFYDKVRQNEGSDNEITGMTLGEFIDKTGIDKSTVNFDEQSQTFNK